MTLVVKTHYFNLTAVPYAKISEAPCITIEVVNLAFIIASAPKRSPS